MNITNTGTETLPIPLAKGGYDEIGPGETKDLDVDAESAFIKGNVHAQRILVQTGGDEQQAPAEGTEGSPLNETTKVKPTSRPSGKSFTSLSEGPKDGATE